MDFMHDQFQDGRSFRLFNLIDDFNREALAIEIDLSLPSARVIRALQQVIAWRGKPAVIRCDNVLNAIDLFSDRQSSPLTAISVKKKVYKSTLPCGQLPRITLAHDLT